MVNQFFQLHTFPLAHCASSEDPILSYSSAQPPPHSTLLEAAIMCLFPVNLLSEVCYMVWLCGISWLLMDKVSLLLKTNKQTTKQSNKQKPKGVFYFPLSNIVWLAVYWFCLIIWFFLSVLSHFLLQIAYSKLYLIKLLGISHQLTQ